MTDLLDVIPNFPSTKYQHIITGLEAHLITTSDVLASDPIELARRAHLSILDLKLFVKDVIEHFHKNHGLTSTSIEPTGNGVDYVTPSPLISTLDGRLDAVLSGGIAPGYVTEVTGESGAGKTQFLLTLLLSAQLPAPQGLAKGTIYVSTEHALPTQRLQYMLRSNPGLRDHASLPTLDRILSIQIPDLETQDHILTYQLPVAIESKNIGLVVIDSIAANYRAEVESGNSTDAGQSQAKALAARAVDLIRTGSLLQGIAQRYNCAIVVANQVSDRFEQRGGHGHFAGSQRTAPSYESKQQKVEQPSQGVEESSGQGISMNKLPRSSPLSNLSSSPIPTQSWSVSTHTRPPSPSLLDSRLTLDHQMRFFTGWGDSSADYLKALKTPALGLTWTNQIACRIVISREKSAVGGLHNTAANTEGEQFRDVPGMTEPALDGADWSKQRWRRWVKVVFAAWGPGVEEDDKGVEFEIWDGGLRSVVR